VDSFPASGARPECQQPSSLRTMPQNRRAGNSFGGKGCRRPTPRLATRGLLIVSANWRRSIRPAFAGPALRPGPDWNLKSRFDVEANEDHVSAAPFRPNQAACLGTFVWAGNRLFHERNRGQWRKTGAVGKKGTRLTPIRNGIGLAFCHGL